MYIFYLHLNSTSQSIHPASPASSNMTLPTLEDVIRHRLGTLLATMLAFYFLPSLVIAVVLNSQALDYCRMLDLNRSLVSTYRSTLHYSICGIEEIDFVPLRTLTCLPRKSAPVAKLCATETAEQRLLALITSQKWGRGKTNVMWLQP